MYTSWWVNTRMDAFLVMFLLTVNQSLESAVMRLTIIQLMIYLLVTKSYSVKHNNLSFVLAVKNAPL